MAYTNTWDETLPTGSEAANTIDDIIRALKVDIDQRFVDIFGMPNFTADPLRPYVLKFADASDATINLGDNAGTPRTLFVKDKAGANTFFEIIGAASSATGLKITTAAAAGGLAIAVISSGADENLKLDAKGAGTINIGSVSTGGITLSRAVTISTGGIAVTGNSTVTGTLGAGQTTITVLGTTLILNNTNTAAQGRVAIAGQRGSVGRWNLGFTASDTFAIQSADTTHDNFTLDDSGNGVFRAGISATTGTLSSKLIITGNGSVPTASALEIGTNGAGSRWKINVPTGGEINLDVNGVTQFYANASGFGSGTVGLSATTGTFSSKQIFTTAVGAISDFTGTVTAIANTGATNIATMQGGLVLVVDQTSGESALVLVAAANTVLVSQSTGAEFTITLDHAATTNIIYSSGTVKIQNNTGGTKTYSSYLLLGK